MECAGRCQWELLFPQVDIEQCDPGDYGHCVPSFLLLSGRICLCPSELPGQRVYLRRDAVDADDPRYGTDDPSISDPQRHGPGEHIWGNYNPKSNERKYDFPADA